MSEQPVRRTRRAVIRAAAAGVVGLTAGRILDPVAVEASTGDLQYGAENDAGADTTVLTSTNPFRTLEVHGTGAYAISGQGEGAESTGVVGLGSGPGTGVRGQSTSGTGVLAESTSGRALAVDGRAGFLTGGHVSVAADRASVSVTRPWIKAGSLVVATIQRDRPGTYVRGVTVVDGKFRILLNRRVERSTRVAFFVFEQVTPFLD